MTTEPMTEAQLLQWAADTFWPALEQQGAVCSCEVVRDTGPDPVDDAEQDPLCQVHPAGGIARGLVVNLAREVQRLIDLVAAAEVVRSVPWGEPVIPPVPYASLVLRPDELTLLLHGLRRLAPAALEGWRLDSIDVHEGVPMARSLATALAEARDHAR
jgi:hypothetical protein